MSESTEPQWCFAWDPTDSGSGKSRAALVNKNKWPKASVINVAFLDNHPDPTIHQKIKNAVKAWTAPDTAHLKIVFVKDPAKSDIRISFRHKGSWSTIGTSCKSVAKGQPTMNYGWLRSTTPHPELRRVVLHEFGHALGLIHEHQNPAGGIPWNKPAVYKALGGPPNNWDTATIDRNMFSAWGAADETNFTAVDLKSIMMYPISKEWVTDPKFAVALNTDLSKTDRIFIRQQYPKP